MTLDGIRLVSWDVDGTLFSLGRLAARIVRLHRVRWGELQRWWEYHRCVEQQRRTADSRVVGEELVRLGQARAHERELIRAALPQIPPRQAAVRLIREIDRLGIPQVALSDFECKYKIEALGLSGYFAGQYACEQIGFWKPSPVPLSQIQEEFSVQPSQHLHVGDRFDTDGQAAERNGCRFLLIDRSPKLWRTFTAMCSF